METGTRYVESQLGLDMDINDVEITYTTRPDDLAWLLVPDINGLLRPRNGWTTSTNCSYGHCKMVY